VLERREEALTAVQKAVAAYQQLAEARPEIFLSDFVRELNRLADVLESLNQEEEATGVRARAHAMANYPKQSF